MLDYIRASGNIIVSGVGGFINESILSSCFVTLLPDEQLVKTSVTPTIFLGNCLPEIEFKDLIKLETYLSSAFNASSIFFDDKEFCTNILVHKLQDDTGNNIYDLLIFLGNEQQIILVKNISLQAEGKLTLVDSACEADEIVIQLSENCFIIIVGISREVLTNKITLLPIQKVNICSAESLISRRLLGDNNKNLENANDDISISFEKFYFNKYRIHFILLLIIESLMGQYQVW